MQKKICNRLLDERTDEIREIALEIDSNKIIYYFKGVHFDPINFTNYKGPFHIFKEIRDGDKTQQETEEAKKNV